MEFEKYENYFAEGWQLEKIAFIMKRLYDDCSPLRVGERRDMANEIFAVLNCIKQNLLDK